ncbi:MAG: phrB [Devosia sp.]|nr:phrB [Devosia sp.]
MTARSIVWLRNDLRITDNPALSAAAGRGGQVLALYIHEQSHGVRPIGGATRWWLHHSLVALGTELGARGITLAVHEGNSQSVIEGLADQSGADAVFWNRRYAPGERTVDEEIKASLRERGLLVESFGANVLVEPWTIATGQGRPYSVYAPFWKALKAREVERPRGRPEARRAIEPTEVDADYTAPRWAAKLGSHWQIGEAAAHQALARFLDEKLEDYPPGRDIPASDATSRLSPHLRFGEISARQIWHAAMAMAHAEPERAGFIDKFLSELAWRDFNYHQLYHRHDISSTSMQGKYEAMQWRQAADDLAAWQRGQTGLPIVDAGMREMWETGFMQNRVRMLTASLLTKNLLIDWRDGEQWFWDCLVDADVANNAGNWQWIAGSGLDASPYFRIFNPVTQGEKFDPDGSYVRRWVPELARMPDKWIHRPAEAPPDVLSAAGVMIGRDYPAPVVDLRASRARALDAAAAL